MCVCSEPLPLDSVEMSDYASAPETGVVFQIRSPDRNIYTRVNISYVEGRQPRYMLYKGTVCCACVTCVFQHVTRLFLCDTRMLMCASACVTVCYMYFLCYEYVSELCML